MKSTTLAQFAFHPDFAAMRFYNLAANRQPQARTTNLASVAIIYPEKLRKKLALRFFRNT
jgi:hypothetical protein